MIAKILLINGIEVYSADIKSTQIVSDKDILTPLYDDLNTPGYIAKLTSSFMKVPNKGGRWREQVYLS